MAASAVSKSRRTPASSLSGLMVHFKLPGRRNVWPRPDTFLRPHLAFLLLCDHGPPQASRHRSWRRSLNLVALPPEFMPANVQERKSRFRRSVWGAAEIILSPKI